QNEKQNEAKKQNENYFSRPPVQIRSTIDEMIRVNHAGEYGAVRIYQGQLSVLKGTREEPIVEHFLEQEKSHLDGCNESIRRYRARPSALIPLWDIAGFALGAVTAAISKDAAMACTEAVETVIAEHYNDQLRTLHTEPYSGYGDLRTQIRKNRDDEIEHLEKSQEEGAKNAVPYELLTGAIKIGCRMAISIAKKI
ncbi:ubiquinone biosynthesis monooxygenase Coq7, partial [Bonamia ostreae]